MSRFLSPRILFRPSLLLLLLAAALTLATDASALPGVGKLKKSAEKEAAKAAGKPEEKSAGNDTVVFDEVTLELTGDRLAQIVATYDAAKAAGAGRPAAVEKLNKAQDERGKHMDKHEPEIRAIRDKRDEVEGCRHDGLREMADQKMQEYSQKALTDPTIREKYTKIAMQYNAAAASGDTAAIKAAQNEMHAVMLPTRDDTLAVYKKCPPIPAPSPAETKLDAMDNQIASLTEEIRKIDEKVAEAQEKQGGMTRDQFWAATERIKMYLSWRQSQSYSKSATRGFTSAEIEALEKYLEKLRAAMG